MSLGMNEISSILEAGAKSAMNMEQIILNEIKDWYRSDTRDLMLTGQRYYVQDNDILRRVRTYIDENGKHVELKNSSNNKLNHGFVRELVDQKVSYLLSKPFTVQTEIKEYQNELNYIFDKRFKRNLKTVGKEAINKGKAYLFPYYNEQGELSFKKLPSEEIIPLWKDSAHTELDAFIRIYPVDTYEGTKRYIVTKVEYWDTQGVRRYVMGKVAYENYSTIQHSYNSLTPDVEAGEYDSHIKVMTAEGEKGLNWHRVPLICFKYNEEELPLIKFVKSLVDDYDLHKSNNSNNVADFPDSIFAVRGYSGTNAAEFRQNVNAYRVIFTGGDGGVESINLNIDTEAFKTHMELNRKDIYANGRGVDTQSDEFSGNPSGQFLKSLYNRLDLDMNDLESEMQASLEQLLWFVDQHIANTKKKDYSKDEVDFIFNRDMIINESEIITDITNSVGIVSEKTLRANHPYVKDEEEERKQIEKERKEKEQDPYSSLGQGEPEPESEEDEEE